MSRACSTVCLLLVNLWLVAVPPAARGGSTRQSASLVTPAIGGRNGQFTYPGGALVGFQKGEIGGEVAYYHSLTDGASVGVAIAYHAGESHSDLNNPNGTPYLTERLHVHSMRVRIGIDRHAALDERAAVYAGPGLFIARGRARSEIDAHPPAVGSSAADGPNATELGIDGRIGLHVSIGARKSVFGQIGQILSRTSAKDATGRSAWWSSTQEGAMGLALGF